MNPQEKIKALSLQTPIIRSKDAESMGVSRESLRRMVNSGMLVRMGWGLYALEESLTGEDTGLAEISKRVPNGVICLISALHYHELTTQLAFEVWLAIESTSWKPQIDYPPIRVMRFSGKAFHYGIEQHLIGGVSVPIYSIAKTVADCFKFRNKIGLDVALEALRDALRGKRATVDDIWKAAKVCRVSNVIKPYLEAI